MADLTGSSSGSPSLGFGLGLQAEPDNIGYNLAAQGIQAMAARRAREAAAKTKADADFNNFAENIKITNGHPILDQKQTDDTAALLNDMYEWHRQNPNDHPLNSRSFQEKYSKWQADRATDKNQSAAYAQFDNTLQDAIKNPDLYQVDQNALDEYNKSMNQKSPTEGWKKITGNENGYINPMDVTNKIVKHRDFDFMPYYGTKLKPVTHEAIKGRDIGDFIETSDNKYIDVPNTMAAIDADLGSGSRAGQAALRQYGDPATARQAIFDRIVAGASTKSGSRLTQKAVPGLTKEDLDAALATKGLYNLSSAAGGSADGKDETGKVESRGTLTFKPTNATIMLPSATVNVKTNTNVNTSGVNKSVNLGQMDNLPVFVKGPLKGRVIDDAGRKELERLGKWNKGFVKYETFLSGSGVDKEPSELKEGEVSETVPLLIPARGLEGSLKGQKVDLPIGKFLKGAEKYTNELPDEAKSESANISHEDWSSKWAKLKKGETMVGLDGKTYTKK